MAGTRVVLLPCQHATLMPALRLPCQTTMATELAEGERTLGGSKQGQQVMRVCRLAHFARHPDSWKASLGELV